MDPDNIKRRPVIGVMGGGSASSRHFEMARKLGELIAENNYILLCGGRNKGIMEACAKGAFLKNGISIGILPGSGSEGISEYISIPVKTGIGDARNQINILTSDVVAAFCGGPGTISEIAFSIKLKKPLILIDFYPGSFIDPYIGKTVYSVADENEAIKKINELTEQTGIIN